MKKFFLIVASMLLLLSACTISVMAASSDKTPPVVKNVTVDEQGQTLHVGETVHFSALIEDESEIKQVELRMQPVVFKKNSSNHSAINIYLKYDAESGMYKGEYTFKDTDIAGQYYCEACIAQDVSNNIRWITVGDNSEVRKPIDDISVTLEGTSTDINPPVVKSVTIAEQGETLHTGETVHFSALIEDESEIKQVELRMQPVVFKKNSSNHSAINIYLKYDAESGMYKGEYTFKDTDIAGQYYCEACIAQDVLDNIRWITVGDNSEVRKPIEDISVTLEGTSTDINPPVVKSVTIAEQGETLHTGETVHFSASIEDESKIKQVELRIQPVVFKKNSSDHSAINIYLKYDAESGMYKGEYIFKDTDIIGKYFCEACIAQDVLDNIRWITVGDNSEVRKPIDDISFYLSLNDDAVDVKNDEGNDTDVSYDKEDKGTLVDTVTSHDDIHAGDKLDFLIVTNNNISNVEEAKAKEDIGNYYPGHHYGWGFDMKLWYQINGGIRRAIEETNGEITVWVYIPPEYRRPGRTYYFYRYHTMDDGSMEFKQVAACDLQWWQGIYGYIPIKTDKFSLYVMAFSDDDNTTYASSINISGKNDLFVGEESAFKASVIPEKAKQDVVWSSNDENVAKVDSKGIVTAIKSGTATITAETTDGSGINTSVTVTVKMKPNSKDSGKTVVAVKPNIPAVDNRDTISTEAVKNKISSLSLTPTAINTARKMIDDVQIKADEQIHNAKTKAEAEKIVEKVQSIISEIQSRAEKAAAVTDIRSNGDLKEAVQYGIIKGFIKGTSDTTFNPTGNVTRAQFVAFLYRLAGSPDVIGKDSFTDTKGELGGDDFAKAIVWASQNGIVNGFGDGTFRPNAVVTREQAAASLHRYLRDKTGTANNTFKDVKKDSWYMDDINWGVANGIIQGYSAEKFGVGDNTTRGQAVQFIFRAIKV